MVLYEFECDVCEEKVQKMGSMANPPPEGDNCVDPYCIGTLYRIFRHYIGAFKPFVTEDITGKPILIESAEQRDRLLAKHNLTMDSYKYSRKRPPTCDSPLTNKEAEKIVEDAKAMEEVNIEAENRKHLKLSEELEAGKVFDD